MEEMLQLGQHCSMTERRADEATREVSDWLKCDFMQDQVGNIFSGVIASVTGFGFFVRLNDLFIDGLVHVSSPDNDYYRFDQVGQRLIGESGGQTYRPGRPRGSPCGSGQHGRAENRLYPDLQRACAA